MNGEIICQKLVDAGLLRMEHAKAAVSADFKCEYCKLDFLESAENYRQWQWDHIIPKESGGPDDFENIAAACWTCNFCFKHRWNPMDTVEPDAPRSKLIEVNREYIAKEKQLAEDQYLQRYGDHPRTALSAD